jgi:hypothetical protein
MFRSSTIIRELALNLAKAIFTLKHSVKLRRYLLCGCVAACHGMACVLCAVHSAKGMFLSARSQNIGKIRGLR